MATQMAPFGDLGPCEVWWNSSKVATVGEDGVNFHSVVESEDVKEAEHGNLPVDTVLTGFGNVSLDVPFTRIGYSDLASLMPGGTYSAGLSGETLIKVYSAFTGTSLYDSAAETIVKRIVASTTDTDTNRWLHFPKSYPIPDFDILYNATGQRIYMVHFKVFPDASNSNLTWHVGPIV